MRAEFSENRPDISLFLTGKEAEKLRITGHSKSVLEARSERGWMFHLQNGGLGDYLRVIEPSQYSPDPNYWVIMNDEAYQKLVKERNVQARINELGIKILLE